MAWYIDTSAFLKLLVAEHESVPLRTWLADHPAVWSSHLLRTEALRAAGRLGIDRDAVEKALSTVFLFLPTAGTFATAGCLGPPALRSLDALHLASALELGNDLEGILSYDVRLSAGAGNLAITVAAPT